MADFFQRVRETVTYQTGQQFTVIALTLRELDRAETLREDSRKLDKDKNEAAADRKQIAALRLAIPEIPEDAELPSIPLLRWLWEQIYRLSLPQDDDLKKSQSPSSFNTNPPASTDTTATATASAGIPNSAASRFPALVAGTTPGANGAAVAVPSM